MGFHAHSEGPSLWSPPCPFLSLSWADLRTGRVTSLPCMRVCTFLSPPHGYLPLNMQNQPHTTARLTHASQGHQQAPAPPQTGPPCTSVAGLLHLGLRCPLSPRERCRSELAEVNSGERTEVKVVPEGPLTPYSSHH